MSTTVPSELLERQNVSPSSVHLTEELNPGPLQLCDYKPLPDTDGLTLVELDSAIAELESDIDFGKAHGADDMVLAMLRGDLSRYRAQHTRIKGEISGSRNSAGAHPTIDPAAFYGLAGEIVKAIEPYSESDPVAILTNTLVAFGNVVGPIPHFRVEFTNHYLALFIAQVGDTAKGRKGTGWSTPRRMFSDIDGVWAKDRCTGGLSSGEGLIFAVRDERYEKKPIRQKGRVIDYETVLVDEGVKDKRLMLIEEELAQALKVMGREGNILSAIARQAWDGGNLNPLTKSNPIKATGAHVSIIGHITKQELLRYLNETEQANGFANRFIWLMVYRSKFIANPTGIPEDTLFPLTARLRDRVEAARRVGCMVRSAGAEKVWSGVYPSLSEGKPGLIGMVCGRAEAQTMRLACLFALLDGSEIVDVDHLTAALALWDYSERSANTIFGQMLGDPTADRILAALIERGEMTETDIYNLFGRHKSSGEIDIALQALQRAGKAQAETRATAGRPVTIWRRCVKSEESEKS